MGRIEKQVNDRAKEYVDTLTWYVENMNRIEREHTEQINALNTAFNLKMAEVRPKKKTRKKKVESTV